MKAYKITCTPYEGARTFAVYKNSRREAVEFANNYPGHSAKVQRRPVEVVEHHTSTARGYITKGATRRECYAGKYGVGYIEHYPNAERPAPHHSNNYHVITYYIEC